MMMNKEYKKMMMELDTNKGIKWIILLKQK